MKSVLKILILIPGFLFSCEYLGDLEKGNGNVIPEMRELDYFNKVIIGGNFDVILEEGETSQLLVVTDENLHDFIKSDISNKTLNVVQEKKLLSKNKIQMIITYVDLESVRITGAARIQNEDHIKEESLELRMDGAGMIDLKIDTEHLEVFLSGAGVVKLRGETDSQELNLTGAGGLNAFDLKSRICRVTVGGIGGAEIHVTEELDAKLEGIGGIEYIGNPTDIRTEVNGLGSIEPVEEY